jgi:hypothetical protein
MAEAHSEQNVVRRPAGAACARCGRFNAYTKYTCEYCGDRLVWADTFAVASGEKCPECKAFNPYINSTCSSCGRRLPWANALAARHAASGKAEKEERSFAFTILWCAIAFVLFMGYMIYSMAPR